KIVTLRGLFDMPTFRISIKNNEKLHGKIRLCINIYLKLMDVGYCHMPINLRKVNTSKTKKTNSLKLTTIEKLIFRLEGN
ncbi:hypothetical protein, partial [Bacillus sp. dmp5]|uniref:hypothetical protein n=1 Tax=Bacillus sp. dmp5 TaxID=2293328 RepID=UPI001CB8E9C2